MEKNKFILLANSIKVKFSPRWKMRPDYVSFDFFKTTIYWPFILFINNAMSIEDFINYDEILIPDFTNILDVIKTKLPKNTYETVGFNETSYLVKYLQRNPLDDFEIQEIIAKTNLDNTKEKLVATPTEENLITSNIKVI
jgi:hypothetical protein